MITYNRLFEYIKKTGISQYRLIQLGFSRSTLSRMKHNQAVSTDTLDKLCNLLGCQLEDIITYTNAED